MTESSSHVRGDPAQRATGRETTAVVGLCGLGNMGHALAGRLVTRSRVLGADPDRSRREAAVGEFGVVAVDGPAAMAEASVVLLSLPAPSVSLAVAQELAETLKPGSLVVETSTVNPSDLHRTARVLHNAGIRTVDAAILSGVPQTHAGTATLLLGGADADLDEVMPLLEVVATSTLRCGPLGAGMALKVINNAVAHAVMVVLAEAGALAAGSGVPRASLVELLAKPDAGLLRPLTHRFAERMLHTGYEGGMPTDAARKDSTLALALAQETGVPLFATQAAHTVYEIAIADGRGRLDYASIAGLWEQWTGRAFADPETPSRPDEDGVTG
jgi:3-hydroxyisobutyrate dehydrogenase-like beta-hydroxyacid dehydrogenase